MIKTNLFKTAVLSAAIVFGLSACKNDKVTLKFNLQKGQKYEYLMNMGMTMKMEIGEKAQNINTKIKMGYNFEVLNDSAGWKTMAASISKLGMDMNMGPMNIKYDSDNPNADTGGLGGIFAKLFGAMNGGKFTFSMNEKGEIGTITGIKELMEKAMSSMEMDGSAMALQGLSKSFDENSFKQNLSQSFSVYPDKPIGVGESWKKTNTIESNGMKMKMDNTYTLKEVKGNEAIVSVVSKISSGQGMEGMKMEIKGDMTGNINYNIGNGMPTSGNTNFKMALTMEGQPKPMDMEMKLEITGKKM